MAHRHVIDPPGFIIRNTTIAVDYWPKSRSNVITHYFLTHAHSDHTKNLDESWSQGTIYCSRITKKLLIDINGVNERYINELVVGTSIVFNLDDNEKMNVTLIDANHCPGAVMFYFEGYFGRVLATGDFRYHQTILDDTPIDSKYGYDVDICYLDNTYCSKIFDKIPSREEAFKEMIELIEKTRLGSPNKRICILLKRLGKEELLIDLAKAFKCKILVSMERYNRYVNVIELEKKYFTTKEEPGKFCIQVNDIDGSSNNYDANALYICPTALHLVNKKLKLSIETHFIPYTDHSSYGELNAFVSSIKPIVIYPIVRNKGENGDITDMSCFEGYMRKDALNDSGKKYRLLLQSTSLVRCSSRLNDYSLYEPPITRSKVKEKNYARKTTVCQRMTRQRTKRPINKIEYDESQSQSPSKSKVKNVSNEVKWKKINENVEIIAEYSTSDDNDEDMEISNYESGIPLSQFDNNDCIEIEVDEPLPKISDTLIESPINNASGAKSPTSIAISYTLDDYCDARDDDSDRESFGSVRSTLSSHALSDGRIRTEENRVAITKNFYNFMRTSLNYDLDLEELELENAISNMLKRVF